MSAENKVFLYDVHTHMHDDIFLESIEERMSNLKSKNIKIITIGTDKKESQKAKDLSHKYDGVFYTVGLHPHDNLEEVFDYDAFKKLADDKKCLAIGECGLDYFYIKKEKEIENNERDIPFEIFEKEKLRQKDIFNQQVKLAKELNKKLMLHVRDVENSYEAYDDVLNILEKENLALQKEGKILGGIVHFFVGNIDVAKRFMALGFTFSFGGVLTISRDYDDMLKFVPLEYVHAETDSPYVTPKDNEGKRVSKINSSENIEVIINKIAEIKNVKVEDLKTQLEKNFLREFC